MFDGFICEKKKKEIKKYKGWLDYFIRGRQKNCFVINLSFKGFYKTPKDIRLNCSHYAVYNFPISSERNTISRELGVTKSQHVKANENPFSFLYVDKPMEKIKRNSTEISKHIT